MTGGVIYNPTLSIFHSIVAVVVVDDRIGKQRDQIERFLKGLCIKLSKKLVQIFTHFLGYLKIITFSLKHMWIRLWQLLDFLASFN